MTMTAILDTRADDPLARYQARPITTSASEANRRRDGFKFGWELNRMQGGTRSPVGAQLEELYVQGRISKQEYFDLVAALAADGRLTDNADSSHGA
jgi:hypothetical protein